MTRFRIPPSIKWLVVKRSKVHASLLKVEERLAQAQASIGGTMATWHAKLAEAQALAEGEIQSLRMMQTMLTDDLSGIDRTIAQHPVAIEPDLIKPKNTYSARFATSGQMTRLLRLCLYRANGAPVSTTELARRVAAYLKTPVDGELFETLRQRVGRRMRHMMDRQEAIRVHPLASMQHGRWLPGPRLVLDNALALDRHRDTTGLGIDGFPDSGGLEDS